jgi:hypothetical protein
MKTNKTIAELMALGYRTCCRNPEKDRRRMAASGERGRRHDVQYSGLTDKKTQDALYARKLYLNLHNVDTASPTHETRRGAFFKFNLEAMRNWRIMYKHRWPNLPERKQRPGLGLMLYEFGYDEGRQWSAQFGLGMGPGYRPAWLDAVYEKLDRLCIAKLEYEAKQVKWPKIAIIGNFGSPLLSQSEQLATDMLGQWERIGRAGFGYFGDAMTGTAEIYKSLAVYFDPKPAPPKLTQQEKQKDRHGRPVYRGYFKGAARRKY